MRSVTMAETELNLAEILISAEKAPVVIQRERGDLVLLTAAEYQEARDLLHKERIRELKKAIRAIQDEAAANGITEDSLPELLENIQG